MLITPPFLIQEDPHSGWIFLGQVFLGNIPRDKPRSMSPGRLKIDNEDEPFYCVYLGMKELEKMGATKAWRASDSPVSLRDTQE